MGHHPPEARAARSSASTRPTATRRSRRPSPTRRRRDRQRLARGRPLHPHHQPPAEACHEATERWLEQIGLRFDELYCSYDKVARCAEIGIDLLIDDSPVNLQRALEPGSPPATILHPWNEDVCESEDVIAARDWAELAAKLEPILAGGGRRGRLMADRTTLREAPDAGSRRPTSWR